jgi:hypothetical protein
MIILFLLIVLTLIFMTLKLAGAGRVANWSWWRVFSPFWIGPVFVLLLALLGGVVKGVQGGYAEHKAQKAAQ